MNIKNKLDNLLAYVVCHGD